MLKSIAKTYKYAFRRNFMEFFYKIKRYLPVGRKANLFSRSSEETFNISEMRHPHLCKISVEERNLIIGGGKNYEQYLKSEDGKRIGEFIRKVGTGKKGLRDFVKEYCVNSHE
jgi:hypothetical protein